MDTGKNAQKARNNAYMLLRSRPRSEFEMRQRLKMKGYAGDLIDGCIEALKKTGDIDDKSFAKVWVDSRMHRNPVGDIVLRQELKQKGVSEDIIGATLSERPASYDEYDVALDMAREQFSRQKGIDRKKAIKRLYDFLARRGFKFDTVERIIAEVVK